MERTSNAAERKKDSRTLQVQGQRKLYQCFSEVQPSKDKYRVKARIERVWTSVDFKNNDEGEQIHAIIPKQLIGTYEDEIKEGAIVLMEKFNININKGMYRPTQNENKLYFKWNTVMKAAAGDVSLSIPNHKFNLIEFADLQSRFNNDKYLTVELS